MAKKKELDTEEKLNFSAMNDAQPTAQDRQNSQKPKADDLPLTQTDALAMLASALNQCKRAGINWTKRQQGTYLLLAIPNSEIANNGNGELCVVPVITGTD